jgi:hypothetical protein
LPTPFRWFINIARPDFIDSDGPISILIYMPDRNLILLTDEAVVYFANGWPLLRSGPTRTSRTSTEPLEWIADVYKPHGGGEDGSAHRREEGVL